MDNCNTNKKIVQDEKLENSKAENGKIFALCVFNNSKDNQPKAWGADWTKLCQAFSKHNERPEKDGQAWSPVIYKEGQLIRSNKNVEAITMAVLDIDKSFDLEPFKAKLQGIAYVIHTTFGHTPETPKLRIVIPFANPVAADLWPETWQRLKLWHGLNVVDEATKDASRLFFTPSHPPGAEEFYTQDFDGRFLSVDELPPLPLKAKVISIVPVTSANDELGSKERLQEVVSRCQFMQWASLPENQNKVSEPLWMALISNASRFDDREWIHSASNHHDEYDENETENRIDRHHDQSPPITCKRIQGLGFGGCPSGGCKLPSGKATAAPAGLGVWAKPAEESERKSLVEKCQDLIDKLFDGNLLYCNEDFYGYESGYWKKLHLLVEVEKKVFSYLGDHVKVSDVINRVEYFKRMRGIVSITPPTAKPLICLLNGTLDPLTGEILPHDPSYMLRSQIPVEWNPADKCPIWEATLNQIFAPDSDREQKIAFLQEWFGYSLIPDVSQHKFVWMVGGGGNGKSVILDVLNAVIGSSNVSHAQLERLDRAFVRVELDGKLVNISTEMGAEATVADGYLKAIVAGEMIEAERKNEPSYSFRPIVRMIGATNELPRLLDLSDGFFRRAIILTFNRKFAELEQDKQLGARLLLELAGILRWAVDGLKRLKARGHFEIPPSSIAAINQYRQEQDTVHVFVEENLEIDLLGPGIQPSEVYRMYSEWCRDSGFIACNKNNLGKRLRALGFDKRSSNGREYWKVKEKVSRFDSGIESSSNVVHFKKWKT